MINVLNKMSGEPSDVPPGKPRNVPPVDDQDEMPVEVPSDIEANP